MRKVPFVCAIAIWCFIGLLFGYNKVHEAAEWEGYLRGVRQTANYVKCSDWTEFPSYAWQQKAWRYVDDPMRCEVVQSLKH